VSEYKVKDYVNTFNKFNTFLDEDIPIGDITHKETEAYFSAPTTVANKALLNYHTGQSPLWTGGMLEHMVHTKWFVMLPSPTIIRQSKITQIRDAFRSCVSL
jgi:hypothetical protein